MEDTLENILLARLYKRDLVSFLERHPDQFEDVIEMSLTDKEPEAWRAAWLLFHAMEENDERVKPYIKTLIKKIKHKKDGHQRELLKVISRMKINEKHEGKLFDVCMTIWEQIEKSPSVRGTAFKMMLDLSKKYPELKSEIELLTQNHYIDSMSPGIRKSIIRMADKIKL